MTKVPLDFKQKNKGQSFLEMTVVLFVLLLLLTGMVEFGNLLNQYIGLVDGVREGARFGSNNDPFAIVVDDVVVGYDYSAPQQRFFDNIFLIIQGNTAVPVASRTSAIAPIVLDPITAGVRTNGEAVVPDDILVTFYAVNGQSIVGTYGPRSKYGNISISRISPAEIVSALDAGAPSTGILVVEVFYNYHQLLSLPFFTSIIPDPIPMHTYAVMPLAAAEATPGP